MPSQDLLIALALASAVVLLLVVLLWARRRRAPAGTTTAAEPRPATWAAGLAKTRGALARRLLDAWRGSGDREEWLRQVEEILLTSDVGVKGTRALLERLGDATRGVRDAAELRAAVRTAVRDMLAAPDDRAHGAGKPEVVLVVGVNGVGKTTTIGKLAHRYREQGKHVLLVAGDTFRAAAIEQVNAWAERAGAGIVKHQHGADPSAVTYDGVQAARARGADVVIVDTAGRLHVKANLMEELKKIARTSARLVPGAPHQVLLVIDATTGQNALAQARVFHEAVGVTGVVLTKLDGTAKGGIALAIRTELGLPIRYVGLGEQVGDLAPFDADAFAAALFADEEVTDAA
ncbi:MAG: signal recognition particle-docking protein FtsY [Candidatus Binatia bacterium]